LSLGQLGYTPGGARRFGGRRQPSCDGTSRMMREYQVWICERLGVKFPGPTRQEIVDLRSRFIGGNRRAGIVHDGSPMEARGARAHTPLGEAVSPTLTATAKGDWVAMTPKGFSAASDSRSVIASSRAYGPRWCVFPGLRAGSSRLLSLKRRDGRRARR
jgi:hypothetical protein